MHFFRVNGFPYASLTDPATNLDICKGLVTDGILLVEKRRERKLAKLVNILFITYAFIAPETRVAGYGLCVNHHPVLVLLPFHREKCLPMAFMN